MGVVKLSTAGILDYQKYSSALAGNSPYIPFSSAFELLETEILTGSRATVTFSGLVSAYSADYQHLQVRAVVQSNRGAGDDLVRLQINNATGSVYSHHGLRGNGVTVAAYSTGTSTTSMFLGEQPDGTTGADRFGAFVCDLLDPFDTNKYTTIRTLSGNEALNVGFRSGLYQATTAVDELDFTCLASFVAKSRFSLYGLKAA